MRTIAGGSDSAAPVRPPGFPSLATGDLNKNARTASLDAIHVAKESPNTTAIAVAHSVGHAVATAHMADHSSGAALHALKAVKSAGGSVSEERMWQDEQLPSEIKELVLSARKQENLTNWSAHCQPLGELPDDRLVFQISQMATSKIAVASIDHKNARSSAPSMAGKPEKDGQELCNR